MTNWARDIKIKKKNFPVKKLPMKFLILLPFKIGNFFMWTALGVIAVNIYKVFNSWYYGNKLSHICKGQGALLQFKWRGLWGEMATPKCDGRIAQDRLFRERFIIY